MTHADQLGRAFLPDGPATASGGDRLIHDTPVIDVAPLAVSDPFGLEDHVAADTRVHHILPPDGPPSASGSDQSELDTHKVNVAPLADTALAATIAAIRAQHRERVLWMEDRKRSDLSLGAFLRGALGWSLAIPKAERNKIKTHASDIMDEAEKYVKASRKAVAKLQKTGATPTLAALPEIPEIVRPWAHIVIPKIEMRRQTDELEARAKLTMESLAHKLPIDPAWMQQARGFGWLGLAIIVAEAGDLSNYPNPAKLWMRMGAGILNGRRQGAPGKNAKKADWLKEKYSPVRHSRLVTIGESFVKCTDSPYRAIYLTRKIYEVDKATSLGLIVAPSADIPKARKDEYRSLKHIHNRARRYAEKRLLLHLWRAWNR